MSDDRFILRRRDLLALAPACAVTAGLASSPAAADCLFGHGSKKLSLAYWPASEALNDLAQVRELAAPEASPSDETAAAPDTQELVPAEWLAGGDPALAGRGLRLRVHGLFGPEGQAQAGLADLSIVAHFTPYHEATAEVWRFEDGACACSNSAMTMPVTAEQGLSLSFNVGGESGEATRFTLGGEGGLPKLRRGVYLVTWRGDGGPSLPSWHRTGLLSEHPQADDDTPNVPHRLRLADRRNPSRSFGQPYLVLSFDHAA
ncbi:MAG: hypothetical protein AAF495_00740 [Pseudomonadota bacterium]